MARFLLDEGLPLRAAALLREQGIDARHAREVGLAAADDEAILDYARSNDLVCVTLDHDFHQILAETSALAPSTIFLRAQQLNHIELSQWIIRLANQLDAQLDEGVAVTATRRSLRMRRLPLRQ